MLDKAYGPGEAEAAIYERWEREGAFAPEESNRAPFCIMMPPPNVTGSLHIGHALDQTIQDVLTRHARMTGRRTLWQPGTDHAGIATQMMVERTLEAQGTSRTAIGRDAFIEACWRWKEASHGNIIGQLKRLGTSPDWNRERFTMDEGLSRAVIRAFVRLHREGLIYKDKRLVNWDVALGTAVSDLESEAREIDGHLWHFVYPLEGDDGASITIATTRPETMLGDTAVAVHPEDARYRDLVGRRVILPLVGRSIPIVADDHSDPEKGTGAVKITPAHDFNDFEVGRRHGLEAIGVIDERGRITDEAPEAYRGLDRFEARRRVVADMEALGLLARTEPHRHTMPHGDRSGTPLEPYLTDQWYCDAATLAKPAIEAVESGRTRFVPRSFENVFFEWMRNIQPWCISRQLWWGHRIPAWYGPDGRVFVAEDEAEARAAAQAHYGSQVDLLRDPDVLDTWFSSGLWPFSTLGWPEETAELETFYPTSVLVTGFDIIFFWVARMMMMGLHFMGEVPFEKVLIHGLVRDEKGQKMSKTKGNVVDPLQLVDTYGADALRLALLASAAQGRDLRFGAAQVETWRNFVTKLFNACRFVEMNEGRLDPAFDPGRCRTTLARWIVGETARAADTIGTALADDRLNDAAQALYHFVWDDFCDWYVELAKPVLTGDDPAAAGETRATAAWVIAQVLHLMHPMAPFVSEHLWRALLGREELLARADWPELDAELIDPAARAEIGWLIETVSAIRAARSEVNVPAGARLDVRVFGASPETLARIDRHREALQRLARLGAIEPGRGEIGGDALQVVTGEAVLAIPIGGVIDLDAERARLAKERATLEKTIAGIETKLANRQFLDRAPAEVVEEQQARRDAARSARDKVAAAIERLSSLRRMEPENP